MRVLFLLAIATAAGRALSAQEPPPAFRAGTRVVEVAVAATHARNKFALRDLLAPPVGDLRATGLRLFDNGVEEIIASYEKLGQAGAPASSDAQPQRLSIIVLDALNTSNTGYSEQIYGREGVSHMLSKLPPGDRIAIFALGDKLHLLHDFSTDYGSLRAAVDKYQAGQPANWVEYFPGQLSETIRIRDTLQALKQIAEATKNYPGRKSLLWVSAAFPTQVAMTVFHREAAEAMRELGVADVVLYPISPEGVRGAKQLDSMMEMAAPTGGRVFHGSNDVAALVRGAMDDAREGYLLTFVPKDYLEDGSFHNLRITSSRKGVDLRYRPGYVADRH